MSQLQYTRHGGHRTFATGFGHTDDDAVSMEFSRRSLILRINGGTSRLGVMAFSCRRTSSVSSAVSEASS